MYELNIKRGAGPGAPEVTGQIGRISAILGANGTGKSRLFAIIRDNPHLLTPNPSSQSRPFIYIEGGRVVAIPSEIRLTRQTADEYSTYPKALQQHRNKRNQKLADRIRDALLTLERLGVEEKQAHSDAVDAWLKGGRTGDCPTRKEPPLDRLARLFNVALPALQLTYKTSGELLITKSGGSPYAASEMSDGEKQVLAILADIELLAEPHSFLLVDEPELNLNPALAASLWTAIENDMPEAVFLFATHSIQFAMRPSIETIIVLARAGAAVVVEKVDDLPREELAPFLGAMPNILRNERAVLVEGEPGSFDKLFYAWILSESTIEVVSMGDGGQVASAAKREKMWSKIPTSEPVVGVVDRDYKSPDDVITIETPNCLVLGLHEAESYLCDPKLLHELGKSLKLVEPIPSEDELIDEILRFAQDNLIRTVINRVGRQIRVELAPSVARQIVAIKPEDEVVAALCASAKAESTRATDRLAEGQIKKAFLLEKSDCTQAIKNRDLRRLLRIYPGKELLPNLTRKIGIENEASCSLRFVDIFPQSASCSRTNSRSRSYHA